MKKKLLFISLALVLALAVLIPGVALAAKPVPFSASGTITYISPGNVLPAGESGRWVVVERDIEGTLSGDISGAFTFSYKANVELATQAGNLHGTLTMDDGSYILKVNGEIEPLEMAPIPGAVTLTEDWYFPFPPYFLPAGTTLPDGTLMPKLTLNGRWTFIEGAKGNGNFEAWAQFTTNLEGHVNAIYFSAFDLTGKWQP